MYAGCKSRNVIVLGTDGDSSMGLYRPVQLEEVSPIESKHGPALADRKCQYISIGCFLTRLTGILTG
jgi:hypothetical protein